MGKTAIVTGGSLGFGRAVAAQLIAKGWIVIIDGRDPDAVRHAAQSIGAVAMSGDVNDVGHRADLVAEATRRTGRLDLLVNNASTLGSIPLPPLRDYPLEGLRAALETNTVAPLALIQQALAPLRASKGGVVNVTSDAAVEGYERWGGYGASKAALEQISRVLAVEEPDVRVWWVDPGDMRTRMHQDAFPGDDISDRPEPEAIAPAVAALVEERPPSGRVRLATLLGTGVR